MKSFFCFLLLSFSLMCSSFAQADKGKNDALTFIGTSSGSVLYNAHLVIGLTADAVAHKIYEADIASELTAEQISMLESFVNQLVALRSSGFLSNNDDLSFCNDIINTAGLVKKEAELLKRYVDTQSDADADKYTSANEEAWASLTVLLGLE